MSSQPQPALVRCYWKGCGQMFAKQRLLFEHAYSCHTDEVLQPLPALVCGWREPGETKECGKLKTNKWNMLSHLVSHFPFAEHCCWHDRCEKKFKRLEDLKFHLRKQKHYITLDTVARWSVDRVRKCLTQEPISLDSVEVMIDPIHGVQLVEYLKMSDSDPRLKTLCGDEAGLRRFRHFAHFLNTPIPRATHGSSSSSSSSTQLPPAQPPASVRAPMQALHPHHELNPANVKTLKRQRSDQPVDQLKKDYEVLELKLSRMLYRFKSLTQDSILSFCTTLDQLYAISQESFDKEKEQLKSELEMKTPRAEPMKLDDDYNMSSTSSTVHGTAHHYDEDTDMEHGAQSSFASPASSVNSHTRYEPPSTSNSSTALPQVQESSPSAQIHTRTTSGSRQLVSGMSFPVAAPDSRTNSDAQPAKKQAQRRTLSNSGMLQRQSAVIDESAMPVNPAPPAVLSPPAPPAPGAMPAIINIHGKPSDWSIVQESVVSKNDPKLLRFTRYYYNSLKTQLIRFRQLEQELENRSSETEAAAEELDILLALDSVPISEDLKATAFSRERALFNDTIHKSMDESCNEVVEDAPMPDADVFADVDAPYSDNLAEQLLKSAELPLTEGFESLNMQP